MATGFMPCSWSSAPMCLSSVGGPAAPPSGCYPWRMAAVGGGSGGCFLNKLACIPDLVFVFLPVVCVVAFVGAPVAGASWLAGSVVCLVPVLQVGPHLHLYVRGHQGDGGTLERGWRSSLWRLGSSSSSSMLDERRWRLLLFLSFDGCDGGGRWPVFSSPSVTFLVEWRPPLFLPACTPCGRQFQPLLGGLGVQVLPPRRSRCPKWSVPGDGEVESAWKLIWTRSRFPLSVWGPFCKS